MTISRLQEYEGPGPGLCDPRACVYSTTSDCLSVPKFPVTLNVIVFMSASPSPEPDGFRGSAAFLEDSQGPRSACHPGGFSPIPPAGLARPLPIASPEVVDEPEETLRLRWGPGRRQVKPPDGAPELRVRRDPGVGMSSVRRSQRTWESTHGSQGAVASEVHGCLSPAGRELGSKHDEVCFHEGKREKCRVWTWTDKPGRARALSLLSCQLPPPQ